MTKGFFRVALSIFLIIGIFIISYKISFQRYNNETEVLNTSNEKSVSNLNNLENSDDVSIVSSEAKIIFKTEFEKSNEIKTVKQLDDPGIMVGLNRKDLEQIYLKEGYLVQSIDNSQVVLLKKVDSYSPNKYFLGIYNNEYLAIFKTDNEGKEYIEDYSNDVKKDIKIESLKNGDKELLSKGNPELQFETKKEAEATYSETYRT